MSVAAMGVTYVLIVALAALCAWFAAGWHRLARENRRLAQELPGLWESARFGRRLHTEGGGAAARELAQAVNELAGRYETIRHQAAALEQNVRLSVAGIAHDLRTPLTSLSGYLQLLESTDDPVRRERYEKAIAQSVDVLKTLNENFYELSRLELGQERYTSTDVDLVRTVTEAFLAHVDEFDHLGLDVRLEEQTDPVFIRADEPALHRIVGNLVQNLLRYATDWVRVGFVTDEARAGVAIANRTVHLLPDDIDRIFDRFTTADPSRGGQSLGLGLYVSRGLVSAMGGTIEAAHTDDILTLTVWLPRADGDGSSGPTA